jgi:hypothetical protein
MEQWKKDLNKSKAWSKDISIIRAALKDWKRPCEVGTCEYKINNLCSKWDCVPEVKRIKDYKESLT